MFCCFFDVVDEYSIFFDVVDEYSIFFDNVVFWMQFDCYAFKVICFKKHLF